MHRTWIVFATAIVAHITFTLPAAAVDLSTANAGVERPALTAHDINSFGGTPKVVATKLAKSEFIWTICSDAYGQPAKGTAAMEAAVACTKRLTETFRTKYGLGPMQVRYGIWYQLPFTRGEVAALSRADTTPSVSKSTASSDQDQPAWVAKYATELTAVKEQTAANTAQLGTNTASIAELKKAALNHEAWLNLHQEMLERQGGQIADLTVSDEAQNDRLARLEAQNARLEALIRSDEEGADDERDIVSRTFRQMEEGEGSTGIRKVISSFFPDF